MDRRAFLAGTGAVLLAAPLAAEAQEYKPAKLPRIGALAAVASNDCNLVEGLRDVGYIEGRNIEIEWRPALGKPERFPDQVAELVRHKVDVIVAANDPAIATARLSV